MQQFFEFLTILQFVGGLLLLPLSRGVSVFLRLFAVIVELVELRKAHGWTQEQAAEAVGVEPRTWQRWERGVAPRSEAMRRLADILEISYADLMAYQRCRYPSKRGRLRRRQGRSW